MLLYKINSKISIDVFHDPPNLCTELRAKQVDIFCEKSVVLSVKHFGTYSYHWSWNRLLMVFRNLILCSSVVWYQDFGGTVHQSQNCECEGTLELEAENFYSILMTIHQTAWGTHLHNLGPVSCRNRMISLPVIIKWCGCTYYVC